MKLFALIEDTVRSRITTVIVYFALATFFLVIGLIVAIFVDPASMVQSPGSAAKTQQGPMPIDLASLPGIIDFFLVGLAGFVHFSAILLSVFATAGIIPSTLEKGTVDLFLSKPISRAELLLGRFLGAILIVFVITAYFVFGAWLIVSIKTGYWNPGFLSIIVMVTVAYAVIYTAMMALGISTRSSAATIIIVFFYIYILAPILAMREVGIYAVVTNDVVRVVVDGLYYILPKSGEIGNITAALILKQSAVWMPLWSSALFGAAMYGLSLFLLRRKDF
ncbi:MAG: ABC transporter permease subunit [Ignavibacteriae bacterium]|nr:ABC transporter permease subunit [Ignavibacteriota bacterium]